MTHSKFKKVVGCSVPTTDSPRCLQQHQSKRTYLCLTWVRDQLGKARCRKSEIRMKSLGWRSRIGSTWLSVYFLQALDVWHAVSLCLLHCLCRCNGFMGNCHLQSVRCTSSMPLLLTEPRLYVADLLAQPNMAYLQRFLNDENGEYLLLAAFWFCRF